MTGDLTRLVAPLVWTAFDGDNMRSQCKISGMIFHASSEEDQESSDALNVVRVVAALDQCALDRLIAEAVAAERERCAKVAEASAQSDLDYADKYPDEVGGYERMAHRGSTVAAAIREQS